MNQKVEMLRTAIPYFDSNTSKLLETMARTEELRAILAGGDSMTDLAVQSRPDRSVDVEGLLQAIRSFCNEREQKMIDMILNFLMVKGMMDVMQPMMDEGGGTPDGMMETIMSMMGGL